MNSLCCLCVYVSSRLLFRFLRGPCRGRSLHRCCFICWGGGGYVTIPAVTRLELNGFVTHHS
jgi:hypothetical protein